MALDAITIAVAAIVAAASLAVGWKRPFAVLSLLVLAVPFRDFSTRWLNAHSGLTVAQVTAIGRWWFAVIFTLLALEGSRWAVRRWRDRWRPRLEPIDWLLVAAVALAVIATLASREYSLAFVSLRGYLQPLGVFLLARLIRPTRGELRILLAAWLVVGMIMVAFALVQVAAWDEAIYRSEGYLRQDGSLVTPYAYLGEERYLRPTSTVSGPNELGADMLLLALLAGFGALHVGGRERALLAVLAIAFVGGLALTVSRSAAIGLFAALGAAMALTGKPLLDRFRGMGWRARRGAVLAGAAILTAVAAIFYATGLLAFVARTAANVTTAYHFVDSVEALEFLLRQPQGVGMGLVEPKGALSLIEAGGAYHVEGSLFQIAMEMGVWGLAAWLAFWAAALARIRRNWARLETVELRVYSGAAFAGWIGSLVAFVFLPLMQSISLMVWLWFLLGIGYASREIETQWAVEALERIEFPSSLGESLWKADPAVGAP